MNYFQHLKSRLHHLAFAAPLAIVAALGSEAAAQSATAADFTLTFAPDTVSWGGQTLATYRIENTGIVNLTGLGFTHSLPSGLSLAATTALQTDCTASGGAPVTLSAPSGGSSVNLADAVLPVGDSCTLSMLMVATSSQTSQTTGDLTSNEEASLAQATFSLTVSNLSPVFSKSLDPTSVPLNGTTTMTYLVENPEGGANIATMSFSETLPAGLVIASPSNATTDCENAAIPATLTATPGTQLISYSFNGLSSFPALAATETCTVSVDVQGTSVGTFEAVSGSLTANGTSVGYASAALEVTGFETGAVGLTKVFSGDPVSPGGSVDLSFTLVNTDPSNSATAISFTDNLETMLSGATLAADVSSVCGGNVTGAGTGLITFSGGTLSARDSCSFDVSVSIPGAAAGGNYLNTTSVVTATIDGDPVASEDGASDTLTVASVLAPSVSMSITDTDASRESVIEITITNNDPNPASDVALDFRLTPPLPETVSLVSATSNPCGSSTPLHFISGTGTRDLRLIGGNIAGDDSCTFTATIGIPSTVPPGSVTLTTSSGPSATISASTVTGSGTSATFEVGSGELGFSLSKTFAETTITRGDTVGLTFLLENTDESGAGSSISFTDDLDSFLSGTTFQSLDSKTCDGTVTGVGTGTISYAGGSLASGANCSFSVTISTSASATANTYTNTTSNVSASKDGGSVLELSGTSAEDTLTVTTIPPIDTVLSLSSNTLAPGASGTLYATFTNNTGVDLTYLSFVAEPFSNLTSPALSNASAGTCSGASVNFSGTTLTGATITLTAGESCQISTDFMVHLAQPPGAYNIELPSITEQFTGGITLVGGADPVVLTVSGAGEGTDSLTLSKAFTSSFYNFGTTGNITFSLQNNTSDALSAIAFTDDLEDFLSGSIFDSVVSDTCGFTATGQTTDTIALNNGALSANAACSTSVAFSMPSSGTPGSYTNTTSDVSLTRLAASETASSASANVEARIAGAPSFSKSFSPNAANPGTSVTLQYVISNPVTSSALSGLTFSDPIGADIPGATATALPGSSPCGAGSSVTGSSQIELRDGALAAGESCTFSVTLLVPSITSASYMSTASDLSSSGVTLASGPARDLFINPPPPGFAKEFTPDSVLQEQTSTLVFTIDASANTIATPGLDFTDTLPSGMTVATPSAASTTCTGGVLTAVSGGNTITYSSGSVAANSSCTVSVDVVATNADSYANTSGALTSDFGSSGTASDTLTVTASPVPGFDLVIAPDTMAQGDTTTLTFTIDNTGSYQTASSLAFTNTLPTGVTVASPSNIANTCGGTFAADTASSLSLSGGSLAPLSDCELSVDVTSVTVAAHVNTSGDLTSSIGNSGTASDTLTVTAAPVPNFAKAFGDGSMVQGDVTTLTLTIDNSGALIAADDLDFTDNFPTGMLVADTPNASTTCTGGTLTAVAGASQVSYTNGSVAAGASCTVSLDVTSAELGNADNLSGDLTSSLGNSGTAADSMVITAAPVPVFGKAFSPSSIEQGGVSTLTFTIDNSGALISAEDLAFTDDFPTGLTIADPSNASTTCNSAVLTAEVDATSLSLTGGVIGAGETCEVEVDVTSVTVGSADNTSGDLTSSLGNSGTASASLEVTAAPVPTFAKAFDPDTIAQGETSTLTFTINNSGALILAEDLAFTDDFPAGMMVADPSNASTTCGSAVLTAEVDGTSVSLVDGSVEAGETCEVVVDVTSITVGSADNTSGDLTSSLGNSGTATASLTITAAPPPTMTQQFVPPTFSQGGQSTLTVTIDNTGNSIPATGLGFSGDFNGSLFINNSGTGQRVRAVSHNCGGTLVAPDNSTRFSFSDGEVAALSSCTIQIDVTSNTEGTPSSVLSALSSSLGSSSAPAPAEVTVTADVNSYVTFIVSSDENGDYVFTSDQAELSFIAAVSDGGATVGPISIGSGSYQVTHSAPDGVGLSSISCSDDDSVGEAASGLISLELAPTEAVTCTLTALATRQKTVDTIHNFLHRRSALLLANQPSRDRRLQRLNSGGVGGQTLSFATGDIVSMSPVQFDPMTIGSGNYHVTTSSQQVRVARAMTLMAHDPTRNSMYVENKRWDVWFEGIYNRFEGSSDSEGHFGVAYLGADYVFSQDLLVGALVQFDTMRDSSDINGTTVDGRGWMVGPYVTARLKDNLIFDGRFAIGQSVNDISPFNTYTDTFETTRVLVDASLTGQYQWQQWTVSPNVAFSYIQENQHAYVDSLGVTIPSQKLKMGQLRFGPNFSRRFTNPDGSSFVPYFTLDGIYTFQADSGLVSASATNEALGLRARVEAGFTTTNRYGTELQVRLNYDGIGRPDFESYGATVKLTVPLQ